MPSVTDMANRSSGEADLIVRGRRIVTPEGERAAAIHIRGAVITRISGFDDVSPTSLIYEARDLAVMPGTNPDALSGKVLQQRRVRPPLEGSPLSSKCR